LLFSGYLVELHSKYFLRRLALFITSGFLSTLKHNSTLSGGFYNDNVWHIPSNIKRYEIENYANIQIKKQL